MAANPETAVTVVEPTAALQVNLDGYPEDRYNRLIPVQTLGLSTDLIKPIVQAVVLQPTGSDGKSPDHYSSPDIPQGRRALTKRALDALASTAGIDFTEERRLDDGSEPAVCGVQVRAEMLLPTGRRITTTGTKWVDMRRMNWSGGLTGAQASKFKATIYEHTASRARNRAIRSLLSLQQSYSLEELRKPFAVVSFVPNMDHPEIRSRILDAMAPAIASTFGPTSPQLAAGQETVVPEAPEDDEPPRQLTAGVPADDVVEAEVREESAGNGDGDAEPSWMQDAAPAEAAPRTFAGQIRESASDPSAPKGAASAALKKQLGEAFSGAGLGWQTVAAGMKALWPECDPAKPTAAQARAIVLAAESDEAFAAHWRELAGQAGSAAKGEAA